MGNNYVPLEELERFREYYNKQEGRNYPCSNQIVRCFIVTNDKDKATEYMKDKNVIKKIEAYDRIEWILENGERWMWRYWNDNARGYRIYKMAIDKFIDKDLFYCVILPRCATYCCSVEII